MMLMRSDTLGLQKPPVAMRGVSVGRRCSNSCVFKRAVTRFHRLAIFIAGTLRPSRRLRGRSRQPFAGEDMSHQPADLDWLQTSAFLESRVDCPLVRR